MTPTDDEIDDAIDEWNERGIGPLHEWLGWSIEEFNLWVADPDAIPQRPLKDNAK